MSLLASGRVCAGVLVSTWWARTHPEAGRQAWESTPLPGGALCLSWLCSIRLSPCPAFSLTSPSSCRKMRSSEKYSSPYVQGKCWKGTGVEFRCSLEGVPSFSAHSWGRYFLLGHELCFSLSNFFFCLGIKLTVSS